MHFAKLTYSPVGVNINAQQYKINFKRKEVIVLYHLQEVYPVKVDLETTLLDDRDLIDFIREECGDIVSDVVTQRLSEQNRFKTTDEILDLLDDIREQLNEIERCAEEDM